MHAPPTSASTSSADVSTRWNAVPPARREQPEEGALQASLDAEDNRITHGCINVAQTFYSTVVKPTFEKGGVVYVVQDTKTIQAAFPGCDRRVLVASATEANKTSNSTLVAR